MAAEVLQFLAPKSGDLYLDVTAGYGGHAKKILQKTKAAAVLVDRDSEAAAYLAKNLAGKKVQLLNQDYLSASQKLKQQGKVFDLILADLGVSSPHLNKASRGFSFMVEGPLDMRMDRQQSLTAETVVNSYSEKELATIIKEYGEEPRAKKVAHEIVTHRPLKSTEELAAVVARVVPRGKINPATRTFQAIRMAVNDELEQLGRALPIWLDLLKPDGRIAIISFHSLEDRIVKRALAERSGNRYDAELKLLTKHTLSPSRQEIVLNPRARSAKLRAAVKINTQKEGMPHAN